MSAKSERQGPTNTDESSFWIGSSKSWLRVDPWLYVLSSLELAKPRNWAFGSIVLWIWLPRRFNVSAKQCIQLNGSRVGKKLVLRLVVCIDRRQLKRMMA